MRQQALQSLVIITTIYIICWLLSISANGLILSVGRRQCVVFACKASQLAILRQLQPDSVRTCLRSTCTTIVFLLQFNCVLLSLVVVP